MQLIATGKRISQTYTTDIEKLLGRNSDMCDGNFFMSLTMSNLSITFDNITFEEQCIYEEGAYIVYTYSVATDGSQYQTS